METTCVASESHENNESAKESKQISHEVESETVYGKKIESFQTHGEYAAYVFFLNSHHLFLYIFLALVFQDICVEEHIYISKRKKELTCASIACENNNNNNNNNTVEVQYWYGTTFTAESKECIRATWPRSS
jgi:hypothetical protein